jgi:hypothetical protein
MNLVMIIMICVGCALIVAGLVVLGYRAARLARTARDAGLSSMDQVQAVMRRGQDLVPRLQELEIGQRVVAERLRSLSATTAELSYLKDEIDRATGHLSKLKS